MASIKQRLARIAPYLKSGRPALLVAGLGAVVGAATEPMIPALLQPLLDKGFTSRELPLWSIPAALIALFFVRGLAGFVAQVGLASAAQNGVLQLRQAMFERLLGAQPGLYTANSASQLTNTLVYEVQQGTTQLIGAVLTLIKDALTLVALLGYLLWLNWQLTLFVGLLFPTLAFVMRTLGRRLHRLTVSVQGATDDLAYVVEENVLAWRIVRLHGAGPMQTGRFVEKARALRRLLIKSVVASATITPVTQMLAAFALSAVIAVALWQAGAGGSSVGSFVAFITAMLLLVTPIKHLSDVMAPITRGLAAVERSVDLIEGSPLEQGGSHAPLRADGDIELVDVTLRYRDDAEPALNGLSLQVRQGETVALVGPSGAGKSSLINLLPRFIEPSSGELRLDGRPLADWDMRALRRQFALVSQDVVLFNDTVASNVALGDTIDEGRVREALRAANLLEFVAALPQGVHTVVGHNGSQLSGGQRQRLAIARAIYKNAPILILDEATSALDAESERAVQDALEKLMVGRTTLVIAHRLATIEHADRVLVLEAGRLVEQGSHAALLAGGGLYARLHAMQFRNT
ncbi:lipid A export permease/ATP-binding protein MsbA [Pseudorhodoferax sp.]|uniref:lipid A export permease/ATP-binding protein MsbA n=1 Tax=Pseudorhodoferax sp. TaxID=1993553 RepID=UPI002DD6566B|nr:lipid A export permease/ATP-binding protein MsbA [Pseudorhodoferax sp.]